MDLRRLRYFVVVAEELHFTRASTRLFIAQPALSQAIRQLEHNLGAELFTRSQRRVVLTPAGVTLLEDARRILADVDCAVERVRMAHLGRAGLIRIGYSSAATRRLLPKLMGLFSARFPDVEIELHPFTNAATIGGAVFANAVDIGLTSVLETAGLDSRLSFLELERHEMMIAMATEHPLASHPDVDFASMASVDVVMPTRKHNEAFHDATLAVWDATGADIRVVAHGTTLPALLAFVSSGAGVAFVPAGLGIGSADDVVLRPTRSDVPQVGFGVVWDDLQSSAVTRFFLEVARESCPA